MLINTKSIQYMFYGLKQIYGHYILYVTKRFKSASRLIKDIVGGTLQKTGTINAQRKLLGQSFSWHF
jgi:hypothetical protein